jgi:hypothetical protein
MPATFFPRAHNICENATLILIHHVVICMVQVGYHEHALMIRCMYGANGVHEKNTWTYRGQPRPQSGDLARSEPTGQFGFNRNLILEVLPVGIQNDRRHESRGGRR